MQKFSAFLIAAAALIGCDQHDHSSVEPHGHEETPQVERVANDLKVFQVSNGSVVRFMEKDGDITLSIQGPISEREKNKALEEQLFQTKTMEAAYRVMDPEGPVPQAILDYDKRPSDISDAYSIPGAARENGAESALPAKTPLAKTSNHAVPSADAWWDWTADANWWKKDVVGYECDWHEAAYQTNYTAWDDWRYGWYGTGYLMAASHTYGANAYAYRWNGSSWVQTNSTYLQPRHYIVWYSGDTSKRYRRYRVVGNGGAYARIHWGMRWDSQAPSDIGVICHYD